VTLTSNGPVGGRKTGEAPGPRQLNDEVGDVGVAVMEVNEGSPTQRRRIDVYRWGHNSFPYQVQGAASVLCRGCSGRNKSKLLLGGGRVSGDFLQWGVGKWQRQELGRRQEAGDRD
jgi:hypothetical protein